MKYHIITLIVSLLLFLLGAEIPIEVVFIISGLYYINILFFIKYYNANKWLVPPQLFTLLMFIYIFLPSVLIYYGAMIYERFSTNLFNEINIINANTITLFSVSTLWISFLLVNKKKIFENTHIISNTNIKSTKKNKRLFYIFLVLVAIQLYGVVNNISGYLVESTLSSQLVTLSNNFSILILVYYFFNNYEAVLKKFDVRILIMIISLVILGFAFAQKSKVLSPFLYLLLVDYFIRKKFNKKLIIIGFSIFILSFVIVPIIRDSIKNQDELQLSITSINKDNAQFAFIDLIYRTTYVPQLILAINFNDKLPPSVEKLWEYQLLSPIYSVIPRQIYNTKPEVTFGKWFSYNVYGSTRENNMGATYQGILYLNGGLVSVFFGFALLGLFQALFVRLFFNNKYIPIYLSLLLLLFILPQEPWMYYVRLIQSSIAFILIYKLIIR